MDIPNETETTAKPAELVEQAEVLRPGLYYLSTNTKTPFVELYASSVLSACCAEIFCYPLDVLKTRMQIQGEIASKTYSNIKYRGMFGTALGIIKEEGLHKLYGGFSAMALRHSIYTGLKMYIYDALREALIIDKDGKPKLTFLRGAICGIVAGAGGTLLTSPTDLIKVQMQMESKRRLMGEPPRIHNVYQALTSTYKGGGIVALWKGTVPNAWRAGLVTLGDVSFYDLSKRQLMNILDMPDNLWIQFLGAMIAGFAGAVLSTPADVVKSRIMNQPVDNTGRGLHYSGTMDCFTKLVQQEGFLAMYKGFLPYWLRVGPWTLIFWLTFEQIRSLHGDAGY
ncbi:mitochondrial uncoupling protein 4-like [Drosophila montana]|uniref:mitochondrial uncoupling protein 4-like n=1 Tax=Drosophila montana TaxID=40370 RepID=UPI00313BD29F